MKLALSLLLIAALPVSSSPQRSSRAYEFAIDRSAELVEEDWMLQFRVRSGPAAVDPSDEQALRQRWSVVVRAMEEGASNSSLPRLRSELIGEALRFSCQGSRGALNALTIEIRSALLEGQCGRALDLSFTAQDFAAELIEQAPFERRRIAIAHAFIALPEAWRDEDLARLTPQASLRFDEQVRALEDRLPREVPQPCDLQEGAIELRELEAQDDQLRALRIQLRFLRLANALHQGRALPALPDEPHGVLEIEAAAGSYVLRSSYSGVGRRSPYTRVVTLL